MPLCRKQELGKLGEDLVAGKLADSGWQILSRNFRGTGFELDIVALKNGTLICVEVKTRSFGSFREEEPDLARIVPPRKIEFLKRGLDYFCGEKDLSPMGIRVDLAMIYHQKGKAVGSSHYVDIG